MSANKKWTAQEEETLKALYPTKPARSVAKKLGRTAKSVAVRAARLGIEKQVRSPYRKKREAGRGDSVIICRVTKKTQPAFRSFCDALGIKAKDL